MSYLGKKFTWKNVSDFLTDKELKMVLGGSSSGYCLCCQLSGGTPFIRYHWVGDNSECFDWGDENCIGGNFSCGNCDSLDDITCPW